MINLKRYKPELLAPAGKEEVLYAVLEAGADAAYLAGKDFNMRRHRKDFNFSRDALARAVDFAHERDKKIYVTVNTLIAQKELSLLIDYLKFLESIQVDTIIVQDCAVIQICQENNIKLDLHSSTMMNVNSIEGAQFLKRQGFSRVVTSRDITIDEVRRIAEGAEIETEYFVHGDMCSAQSGQCYGSGIMMGKSSNRGQCMKPCRWAYQLKSNTSGQVLKDNAYLLAAKDLCLVEQIPDIINAGISSLKIEGRMKPAEALCRIIKAYRTVIDDYCESPLSVTRNKDVISDLHKNRVRDLSTGFAFKNPGNEFFDLKGDREPMFLSYGGVLKTIEDWSANPCEEVTEVKPHKPALTCKAGTFASAMAAVENGVDNLILSWEGDLRVGSSWSIAEIEELSSACKASGSRLILDTPKVITEKELKEVCQVMEMFPKLDCYSISGVGLIDILKAAGKEIWVDYNCNIINTKAYDFYINSGCSMVTPSLESSLENLKYMADSLADNKLDITVHGPLTSMIVEHCLIGQNLQGVTKKEFCQMPCADDTFSMTDKRGQKRDVRTDKYCRNHIMLENDLCALPVISSLINLKPAALRIDARLYDADMTGFLVDMYKKVIENPESYLNSVEKLKAKTDLEFSLGGFPKGISHDSEISLLELKREENNNLKLDEGK